MDDPGHGGDHHGVLLARIRLSPRVAIAAILVLALVFRAAGVWWGLPSALDPDEPLFMMLGLKLLAGPTLDPGWFGHPGTTTIYVTAIVQAALIGIARTTGQVDSARAWAIGFFHDPTTAFVAARSVFVLFGVGCVALTWRIARRLWGGTTASLAALMLALNPLHIAWSAIVRTDVQASFFMLLALVACLDIVERSRPRDYWRAAIWTGAAVATKWPAATVLVAVAAAGMFATRPPRGGRLAWTALATGCAAIALIVISPFILFDFDTVRSNLGGEAQASHLGATGGGFIHNVAWYLTGPLANSFGVPALLAALVGLALALRKARSAAIIAAPALAFVIAVSSQGLVWERWIVPVLPLIAMLAASGVVTIAHRLAPDRRSVAAVLAAAALLPAAVGAVAGVRELSNDTRTQAEHWLAAHARPGARVLVEYPALALLTTRLEFLYPAGAIGCIDGRSTLAGTVKLPAVDAMRGKGREARAILDIGTIDPRKLDACPADLLLLTDYDRYLAEAGRYPGEIANYRRLMSRSRVLAVFAPKWGRSSGPVVRVVAVEARPLDSSSRGNATEPPAAAPSRASRPIRLTSQVRSALARQPGLGS